MTIRPWLQYTLTFLLFFGGAMWATSAIPSATDVFQLSFDPSSVRVNTPWDALMLVTGVFLGVNAVIFILLATVQAWFKAGKFIPVIGKLFEKQKNPFEETVAKALESHGDILKSNADILTTLQDLLRENTKTNKQQEEISDQLADYAMHSRQVIDSSKIILDDLWEAHKPIRGIGLEADREAIQSMSRAVPALADILRKIVESQEKLHENQEDHSKAFAETMGDLFKEIRK